MALTAEAKAAYVQGLNDSLNYVFVDDTLVNALAMNNVYVANYYYEHGSYLAAANRAQVVITDFSGVPAAEPALYIMTLSYGKLGMTQLQRDTERVLDKNYPNSKYKKDGLALLTKKAWWQVF